MFMYKVLYIYLWTHSQEIVDRGINQQEHPEIQVPTHSLAAGNRQAGTRGAGHQLLGTALGPGGQQARLGPATHSGSDDGQQCGSAWAARPRHRHESQEKDQPSALCPPTPLEQCSELQKDTDKTGTSLREAAKSSMLDPLPWELKLWDHSWFIYNGFGDTQQHVWHWQEETEEMWLGSCMVGAW